SWCADCRVEAPDVQMAYEQHRADGLEVVAVYLSEDSAAVKAFTGRLGLTFIHLPDPTNAVSSGYGVPGVPAHFFIDRLGMVRSVQLGVLTPEATQSALAQIIDG
ncbi:MAG: TlpA disulfide reductase family protein, partial [Propionicimonas sp.]